MDKKITDLEKFAIDYIKSWKVTSSITITSSDMENMPSNRITTYDHEDEIARELANGEKE